ncbi:ABC transporter substrate-binding protein, partial [Streptomyces sp. NPDC059900]
MRRRTLLYGAMAAPLLAACSGQSDDGGEESGGRTTLSYGVWDVAQVPGLQKVIDAFEKENPGIS